MQIAYQMIFCIYYTTYQLQLLVRPTSEDGQIQTLILSRVCQYALQGWPTTQLDE